MTHAFSLAVFLLFWLMLACNMGVAAVFGQRTERAFAAFLLGVSLLTLVVRRIQLGPEAGLNLVTVVDWAILLIAWFLALRSDRYWPIWFAAMQSLSVITSSMAAMVKGVPHLVFSNMAAAWALPALLTMAAGTISDWAARRRSA